MSQQISIADLPDSWAARLGGPDASGWLYAFWAEPRAAVDALLWDRFYLGPLNVSRGYRALSTSYVLPDDYGRVRIDWDRLGSGWSVFALIEVITDNASGTVRVEIIDLADDSQEVEMSATANPTTWTVQTALVIPQLTGIKYYGARVKGGDAAIGVGVVGGIYLAAP